jgi:hypothetical protein
MAPAATSAMPRSSIASRVPGSATPSTSTVAPTATAVVIGAWVGELAAARAVSASARAARASSTRFRFAERSLASSACRRARLA